MSTFKAYLTSQEGKSVKTELVDMTTDQLDEGEVLIDVKNFNGELQGCALMTGAGRIIRRFGVGGIDLAGTVAKPSDPAFWPGDTAIATSCRRRGGASRRLRAEGAHSGGLGESACRDDDVRRDELRHRRLHRCARRASHAA
ncbi:hypothetical protein [Casimicrobium huifangae]|uniref:hypothetical protein n=1 Tax=Casimicrobium huifangae TaxID=2591109 RepID=UPI0037850029